MTPQVISLSAAGSTAWIPVDYKQNPFNIDVAVVLSNTPNLTYKVEYTLDDIFNPAITPTAFSHATLVGLTANGQAPITSPVRAIRLTITAWTSGTATMTALQGAVNPTIYTTQGGVRVFKFPGFRKSLLASLVLTSTASRASNIVTVAATAHGITTGATYVGFRYFYPGSPSLAAGWYDSITDVQTNTISFNAPGTDFGSESVNGAAAYTTITDLCTVTIPAGTLSIDSVITIAGLFSGDTAAITKNQRIKVGNTSFTVRQVSTVPSIETTASVRFSGDLLTQYVAAADNAATTLIAKPSQNFTIDQTVGISGNVAAAGGFLVIYNGEVRIM